MESARVAGPHLYLISVPKCSYFRSLKYILPHLINVVAAVVKSFRSIDSEELSVATADEAVVEENKHSEDNLRDLEEIKEELVVEDCAKKKIRCHQSKCIHHNSSLTEV